MKNLDQKSTTIVHHDYLAWLESVPWSVLILGSLTLGLAPFYPPHLLEKLWMLSEGLLVRPIDIFDLVLHGAFPAMLLLKTSRALVIRLIRKNQ